MGASHEAIARVLLDRAPNVRCARSRRRPVSITSVTPARTRVPLSRVELANGWLFGVLFDHMIRAEKAWAAPLRLADRLGHLDVVRIAQMDATELGEILRGRPGEGALHRLWPRLARSLRGTSIQLTAEYRGDAENLWTDGLDVCELKRRLHTLPGMGQKLVSMTVAALRDSFGRRFRGWEEADVAVDRHVARVFVRTGLVAVEHGRARYSVGEVRDDIVMAARLLHRRYPAALDLPAFEIGRGFCHAKAPECRRCPLRAVCPRDRRHWKVG